MKPIEQLTYQGQVRRLRQIALRALHDAGVDFERLTLIFHGENTTFRAHHPGGDHLVRVHRPGYQNRRTIASELELLRALRTQTDLIVPEPVKGVNAFDAPGVGRRNVVIFRWIDGRFSHSFTPAEMERLGTFAARLHLFAEQFSTSDRFDRHFLHIEGLCGETMGGNLAMWPDESRELVHEVVERAADVFDELGRATDVWGIIHADLHHRNRLVCRGGELAAIDFDDCGFGHYLYDIAVMLGFPRHRFPDRYPALFDAYVRGYRSQRPLSDEHLALLPAFFAMRCVAITTWVLGRAADNPYFAERAPGEVAHSLRDLSDFVALDW